MGQAVSENFNAKRKEMKSLLDSCLGLLLFPSLAPFFVVKDAVRQARLFCVGTVEGSCSVGPILTWKHCQIAHEEGGALLTLDQLFQQGPRL